MAALAAILLVAAVFRYWQIGQYPQALHFDESINGLVVQDLLRGRLPQLLTYNDAREPIIFYVMSVPVFLLGPTPGALRVATASLSLLLVASMFGLMRELFGRKTGLLAALICASTVWPIYHGRLATRSILVPVVVSLALYGGLLAWRRRRMIYWTFAGLLFGVVFYTYATNFFIIPAVVLTGGGLFLFDRQAFLERKWGLLLAAGVFIAIGAPILLYRLTHAELGFGRSQALTMFYAGQSIGDLIRTMFFQAFLVARMFLLKGDLNMRHNIPGRAVFDGLMALPFVMGLGVAWASPRLNLSGARKLRPGAALCALWLLVWLAPTFLTKDAPHFLRASGALATLFVWPALGLIWLQNKVQRRIGRWAGLMIAAALVGGSILITTHDYLFSNFLASPAATQEYFGEHVAPILEFNRKYHTGWVGDNLAALPPPANAPSPEQLKMAEALPQPYAQYLIPWLFDPNLRQY